MPRRSHWSGSSENAKVARDLLVHLREQGVDMSFARLWVIDGSKALRSAIQAVCGDSARVQRCRIFTAKAERGIDRCLLSAVPGRNRW